VLGNPVQDRPRVGALGEDHRALDHRAARSVGAGQAPYEKTYFVGSHDNHTIPNAPGPRRENDPGSLGPGAWRKGRVSCAAGGQAADLRPPGVGATFAPVSDACGACAGTEPCW
jgi:hypothetical protein